MSTFRILLISLWTVLAGYTVLVLRGHGPGLIGVFLGDIRQMGWAGQFDVDFAILLILSALWVAWRHHYSGLGLGLGSVALVGGSLFLIPYLVLMIWRCQGDMKQLLLGPARLTP